MAKKGKRRAQQKTKTASTTAAKSPEPVQPPLPAMAKEPPSRVLYIPEIVDHIFMYLAREDNVRNALVCKTWSDIALRIIWREVTDPYTMFSVLAPMVKASNDEDGVEYYRLEETPSVEDWNRFDKYARHIKRIEFEPKEGLPKRRLLRQALLEISHSRIRQDVFPQLSSLRWWPTNTLTDSSLPTASILFMQPTVTSFSFCLPRSFPAALITKFLSDIPLRLPNLTDIELSTVLAVKTYEDDLCRLVSRLPKIRRVALPANYLTNRLAESLAVLPALTSLTCGYSDTTYLHHNPVATFNPSIPEGSFKSLRTHAAMAPLPHITSLIRGVAPRSLSCLRFRCPDTTLPKISEFFQLCAQQQPRIQRISLKFHSHTATVMVPETVGFSITRQIMQPIAQLSYLSELRLEHPYPLALTVEDVGAITASLRHLQVLSLNPSPMYCETSPLTLDVLSVIAKNCPRLEELELFVDASSAAPLPPPPVRFAALESLALGPSLLLQEALYPVALYLSNILPFLCELDYGAWWEDEAVRLMNVSEWALDAYDIACQRNELWEEAQGLLRLLAQAREEEREKAKSASR